MQSHVKLGLLLAATAMIALPGTALADKLSPNYKNVSSTFKMLEDGTEMVMLDGKQMATATFAINVQLFTGEEKPAAPVRIKK